MNGGCGSPFSGRFLRMGRDLGFWGGFLIHVKDGWSNECLLRRRIFPSPSLSAGSRECVEKVEPQCNAHPRYTLADGMMLEARY